jgi:hypothetical protein
VALGEFVGLGWGVTGVEECVFSPVCDVGVFVELLGGVWPGDVGGHGCVGIGKPPGGAACGRSVARVSSAVVRVVLALGSAGILACVTDGVGSGSCDCAADAAFDEDGDAA